MRILQISDCHLVARADGMVRGRPALPLLEHALAIGASHDPDLVLITGDLCQDESWSGYVRLKQALSTQLHCPVAVLPGNHDHPILLDAVLGRTVATAPADLLVNGVRLVLLNSHCCGSSAGLLGSMQLAWLQERLADPKRQNHPLVVALHHPPVLIGHPVLDAMPLIDHGQLRSLLIPHSGLRAVVFGHIHQHWQGRWQERPDVPLHLGVTEAGMPPDGVIKTRIAFEQLISRGIGDTVRVSLTVPNVRKPEEIEAAQGILADIAIGRVRSVVDFGLDTLNIISCPSCSRVENEAFIELAEEVKQMTAYAKDHAITIAVMGCRVNGPGETDDADLGLWCGPTHVNLKKGSDPIGAFPYDAIIPRLREELDRIINERGDVAGTVAGV